MTTYSPWRFPKVLPKSVPVIFHHASLKYKKIDIFFGIKVHARPDCKHEQQPVIAAQLWICWNM